MNKPGTICIEKNNYLIYYANAKGYIVCFIFSCILTAVSFLLVINNTINNIMITSFVLFILALMQIIAHMIYFLHMNKTLEEGWVILALFFTITVVCIMLIGSFWVMYNMNHNMIPQNLV